MEATITTLGELSAPPRKTTARKPVKTTARKPSASTRRSAGATEYILPSQTSQAPRPQRQAPRPKRLTPGDVIRGDIIRFKLDLKYPLPFGATLEATARKAFINNMDRRGFRQTTLIPDTNSIRRSTTIEGEATVVSDNSLSTRDVANFVLGIAGDSFMRVNSSFVEIKVKAEDAANYRNQQIRDVSAAQSNENPSSQGGGFLESIFGNNRNGGGGNTPPAKDDDDGFLSSIFGSGINFLGIKVSPLIILLVVGFIAVKAVKPGISVSR